MLMRPHKNSGIFVNVESKCHKWEEAKAENYCMTPAPDLSPNDGWLVIVNSEIMCGVMDKATIGSGKKKSIFGVIMRDYGPHEAAAAMNRLAKLCARWLGESTSFRSISSQHTDEHIQLIMAFHSESTTSSLVQN